MSVEPGQPTAPSGACGARALRVVRVYGPDGGLRLIDFEAEVRDAQRDLHEAGRAGARKGRGGGAAVGGGEVTIARAVARGEAIELVAAAAGVSAREVRAIV